MVALDWRMAFDAVNVDALLLGLQRFGLPSKYLRIIQHIYSDRRFIVDDDGTFSSQRQQRSGISQGCPLSPFIFIMLMTVVVHDTTEALNPKAQEHYSKGELQPLLYADDTLVVSEHACSLQNTLDTISNVGARFGLALHWDKFQLLQINGSFPLHAPDNTPIVSQECLSYLGCHIYANGSLKSELNRRLGIAWSLFCVLNDVWKHSTLSTSRKLQIFRAVIVSRLLYGLASAWLNKCETRRLDGFFCRCLRVVLRIPPAYFSRVPNSVVLEKARQRPLSRDLLKQQLTLFGRIARALASDPLRKLTFHQGLCNLLGPSMSGKLDGHETNGVLWSNKLQYNWTGGLYSTCLTCESGKNS